MQLDPKIKITLFRLPRETRYNFREWLFAFEFEDEELEEENFTMPPETRTLKDLIAPNLNQLYLCITFP